MRECKEEPINGHYCCGDGKTVPGVYVCGTCGSDAIYYECFAE